MSSSNGKKKAAKAKPVASAQARRSACAVLQVMAGERTPADAATALAISTPAYYLLESRALDGLVKACEPRLKRGRVRTAESEIAQLKKQCARLEREVVRYQALARASQRSAGVPAPKKPAKKTGKVKGKRKRKPSVRALKMAKRLQPEAESLGAEKRPAPAQ